jgi:hypothetical protein
MTPSLSPGAGLSLAEERDDVIAVTRDCGPYRRA